MRKLQHKKLVHPEHASWWDRYEKKILLYLFIAMIALLFMPFVIIDLVIRHLWVGVVWFVLLFLHTFFFYILMSRTDDLL